MSFVRRHVRTIIILLVAIIAIVAVILVVNHFSAGTQQNAVPAGTIGVVSIDGQNVGVFDSQSEAEANKVTADAGVRNVQISGSGNVDVSASVGGIPAGIITNTSGNDYDMNLEGLSNGTTVVVKVSVGGDGSFIGNRLSNEVDTHFFAVSVNNPDPTANTATTMNVPNGTVHFGDSTFQTYGSEAEAQNAIAGKENQFTIPTGMAKNLVLTAEPTDGTARIFAHVCMVDGNDTESKRTRLNQDSNWSGTFDVSEYAGHQVTICLKAENGMALSNGYSYVSFFVPVFTPEEEYIEPVIVP